MEIVGAIIVIVYICFIVVSMITISIGNLQIEMEEYKSRNKEKESPE
jgi:hypothetical protein